jgi:hypothetical protein
MPDECEATRPTLCSDASTMVEAAEAVARLVGELQAGLYERDADMYNRQFASDVLWGSAFGATVQGYEQLHAIHSRLDEAARPHATR